MNILLIQGEERPVEIGRVEDENIPARSEFGRAFEISVTVQGGVYRGSSETGNRRLR